MNGRQIFRFATRAVAGSCATVLDAAGLSVEEIDLFVPHQANLRIIDNVAKRIGVAPERVFTNLERYGNIPVRVAGYSQMFKLIDRELQDHIIARTKHKK